MLNRIDPVSLDGWDVRLKIRMTRPLGNVREAFLGGLNIGIASVNIVSTKGVLIDAVAKFARKTKERRLLAVALGSVET